MGEIGAFPLVLPTNKKTGKKKSVEKKKKVLPTIQGKISQSTGNDFLFKGGLSRDIITGADQGVGEIQDFRWLLSRNSDSNY